MSNRTISLFKTVEPENPDNEPKQVLVHSHTQSLDRWPDFVVHENLGYALIDAHVTEASYELCDLLIIPSHET